MTITMTHRTSSAALAAAALLALAACNEAEKKAAEPGKAVAAEPVARPAAGPTIEAYTASEQGFLVDSYAVVDGGEILLIDTQLIKPEVDRFIERVKRLDGKVTTIYVTHPHPDHLMGAQWLLAAFPDAKLVAAPATVAILEKSAAQTLAYMKSKEYFGGALAPVLAERAIIPTALTGDRIKVGDSELQVLSYPDAEAKTAHPLYEPKTGSLFTGDIAYHNVHAWLKDTPPSGWIAALEGLKKLGARKVYPGHGEPGGPEILDATLGYLRDFESAVAAARSQKELAAAVKAKYPDHRLPIIVDIAATSYFKK
jgi:glyoxylase-like metal-dependent hydrolase (beta-lactamase superfamily II)